MTASTTFERYLERVTAGERLQAAEIHELATTPDILPLGMLADAVRRRMHETNTTFLRLATVSHDRESEPVPPKAREVRVTGSPDQLSAAVELIARVKSMAGDRTVSALSWADVERFADGSPTRLSAVLQSLRQAGLDSFAELPLDRIGDLDAAVDAAAAAGFQRLRLTIDKAPAAERTALFLRAAQLEQRYSCIQAINPLPMTLATFRPTTGYDDVKTVAIARLAAPEISTIQVDWLRYGPKLAQVALTFGADDIDGVSPSDEAPEGRRRAPLEEICRNIEAAGYKPIERDGRFAVLA